MTEEVRMARVAALATAAAAPVALALAWYAAGSKGLLGAAFGLALAVAFFSATLLAVGAAGRTFGRAGTLAMRCSSQSW